MTELETLERAKMYMEMLAKGINPVDGCVIPDGDVVNNVRISRCFEAQQQRHPRQTGKAGYDSIKQASTAYLS